MNKEDLKEGDKVKVLTARLGWFPVGSTITFLGHDDPGVGRFSGPAREADCGGTKCKEGDIINGFVYFSDVEPLYDTSIFEETKTVTYETIIRVNHQLTMSKKQAIAAILESK